MHPPDNTVLPVILFLRIELALVSLVQTGDDLSGDVVSLVGIEQVVALLGKDQTILVILIEIGKVMLDRIVQCLVVLVGLSLELIAQPLVERLQVTALLLQPGLDSLSLLPGVSVLLHLLLEVGGSALQLLLAAGEGFLNVRTLEVEDLGVLLAELILSHDRVDLDIGNLVARSFLLGRFCFVVHLRRTLVARSEAQCCGSSNSHREENVVLHIFVFYLNCLILLKRFI